MRRMMDGVREEGGLEPWRGSGSGSGSGSARTWTWTSLTNRQIKDLEELIRRLRPNPSSSSPSLQSISITLSKPSDSIQATIDHLSTIAHRITVYLQQDPSNPPDSAQRFTSLLTRLIPLPHPKQKSATLQFLLNLAPQSNQYPPPSSISNQNLPTILDHPSQKIIPSSSIPTPHLDHQPLPLPLPTPPPPPPPLTHPSSAAARLKRYRRQNAQQAQLPEHLLLRDMIYLLQGIDGRYAYFKQSNRDDESWEEGGIGFNEPNDGSFITLPQRDLILKLTELGWLYKKIESAIENPQSIDGIVQQAFAFALKEELGTYYRAIAIVESHLSSSSEINLTSKALLLHLSPTVLRLRMSAALISATKGIKGGPMISVLHSYTDHGDPVVHLFTSNLLEKVSVPWFKTLVSWMWDGELVDPMEEFFIQSNPAFDLHHRRHHPDHLDDQLNLGSLDSWNVWQKKFSFRKEMIPSFISEAFARKIFSTGKSLNFIRHSCGDYEWHETRSQIYRASSKSSLHYKDITGLQRTIESTYSIATRRLFSIFFVKLKLLDHLKAVKDYLLLGRGDFISLLIESLGPSLNKPANTLYRHNLTATLESAIRSTTNETELINRLDVRMLEFNSLELGWDVFMLEYKTERPLDVVMSSTAMEKYMRMFRILWKMKRLEYVLDKAWKVVILGVKRSLTHSYELRTDFHRARLVISEMIHFIRQLQSYCHLEVIDCGWQEFERKLISEGGDLDSLIEGHNVYLDRLVSKGMLLSTRSGKENTCLLIAEECFKVILAFKESIDALYTYGLSKSALQKSIHPLPNSRSAPYSRRRRGRRGRGRRKAGGEEDSEEEEEWEEDDDDDDYDEDHDSSFEQLESIRAQLFHQSKSFTESVLDLISSLSTQQDPDMKFLAVRLNFSLFYMRSKMTSSSTNQLLMTSSTGPSSGAGGGTGIGSKPMSSKS